MDARATDMYILAFEESIDGGAERTTDTSVILYILTLISRLMAARARDCISCMHGVYESIDGCASRAYPGVDAVHKPKKNNDRSRNPPLFNHFDHTDS